MAIKIFTIRWPVSDSEIWVEEKMETPVWRTWIEMKEGMVFHKYFKNNSEAKQGVDWGNKRLLEHIRSRAYLWSTYRY